MFATDGKIDGAQNISYFFSDGVPTLSDENPDSSTNNGSVTNTDLGDGIDAAEEAAWISFLNTNNIVSNSVGLGTGVTADYLNPIAYDGATSQDTSAIIVTDLNQLDDSLNATLPPPLTGDILTGNVLESGFGVGADGGYVSEITADGNTYSFDGTSLTVTGSGTSTHTFDATTNVVVITTANNSTLKIDLDDGDYLYQANPTLTTGYTELLGFELSDNDGDKARGIVTLNVNRESYPDSLLNDNAAIVYEEAIATGTNSVSTAEIATGNILSDDSIATDSILSNITIAGGVTDTSVAGVITVTTVEGNVLVVNSDSASANYGDYTYTLNNALDHNVQGNDSVTDNFTYTTTDLNGFDWSASLAVQVVDDTPVATPQVVDLTIDPIVTNLSFIVDVSSSMSDQDLALTEQAISELISQYDGNGTVNVNIVQFYGNGNINSGWIDATSGDAVVLDTTRSGTDIEQGLRQMVNGSYSGNQPGGTLYTGTLPAANQDVMYFFGDGNTYNAYLTDFNAYLPNWNSFVTGGYIDKLFS